MGVVSHIKLYTEGRATEGAWLDNNVGVVSMIILHRGAGYVKLLCIIAYYIYIYSHQGMYNRWRIIIIVTNNNINNNITYLIIYHQNYSGITSMILVYASLVEAPFYLTLANRSVDILTVTGIDCTWLYSDLEIHTILTRPE